MNVGVTEVPTKVTTWDVNTCGYYYQWGRKTPFEYGGESGDLAPDNTFPTYVEGTKANYANENKFIKGNSAKDYSWFSDYKDPPGLPLVLKGMVWPRENQPCPAGWRVPAIDELTPIKDEINSKGGIANGIWTSTSNKNLVLPAAGYRSCSDGSSNPLATFGGYWSSTLFAAGKPPILSFDSSSANTGYLASGVSVRCIQE